MKWIAKFGIVVAVSATVFATTREPTEVCEVECTSEQLQSAPASVQLHHYIRKYADEYDIPVEYAFSIAYLETGYQGPLHFSYRPNQTSFAGAKGAMQIMPATALWIEGRKISDAQLLHDIELNVLISMKLLRKLKTQYQDWGLVFGAYNTGRPCVNDYASKVLKQHYNWITSI